MSAPSLRIGSRGSRLALWQAERVRSLLGVDSTIMVIHSSGDLFQGAAPQGYAAAGIFTKDIDQKLLDGEIDLAVHSLKDLPTESAEGLELAAFLPRAAASDLLVVDPAQHEPGDALPLRPGCTVGTGSLRREALLARWAPRARPVFMRGNVPTRVEKCRDGVTGAVILARAGVDRLGLDLRGLVVYELDPHVWLPAPAQGVIVVECRSEDRRVKAMLAAIDDADSRASSRLERGLLTSFGAGCHSAFAALATRTAGGWLAELGRHDETEGWVCASIELTAAELEACGSERFRSWRRGQGRQPVLGRYGNGG